MKFCSNRKTVRLLLALAMVFATLKVVSDESVVFTVLSGKYIESFQTVRPVSGDLVAGFMGSVARSTKSFQVDVWIPAEWKKDTLCLLIRSRDGRYEGYQEFVPRYWEEPGGKTTGEGAGMFQTVPLAEAKEEKFLYQHAQQLALLAYRGVCGTVPDEITLSFWGGRDAAVAPVIFQYLNAKRADEAFIYYSDLDLEESCAEIPDTNRQVYDFICQSPSELESIVGKVEIEVNLLRLGNFDDAEFYTLHFPEIVQ